MLCTCSDENEVGTFEEGSCAKSKDTIGWWILLIYKYIYKSINYKHF